MHALPCCRSIPSAPGAAAAGTANGGSSGGGASVLDNLRASMPSGFGSSAAALLAASTTTAYPGTAGHSLSALASATGGAMAFKPALAVSTNHLPPGAAAAAAAAAVAPSPIQQLRRDSDASMKEDFEGCLRELQRSGLEEGTIQVRVFGWWVTGLLYKRVC